MSLLTKCPGAFVEAEIEGEIVLMALGDGRFFRLRGSASRIWRLIDGARDGDAIEAMLQAEYAGGEAIRHHLEAFLADVRDAGLVA